MRTTNQEIAEPRQTYFRMQRDAERDAEIQARRVVLC